MLSFGTTLLDKVGSNTQNMSGKKEAGDGGELEVEMEHVLNTGHGVETVGKNSTEQGTEQSTGKH